MHIINTMLSKGERPSIEKAAAEFAMSVRNLQNKLKEEKASYQGILENLRKKIAVEYLKNPGASICEITFLLGFSEQSSFNHVFKKWTGMTPGEYQKFNRQV